MTNGGGHVDPYSKLSSDEDYEHVLRWALRAGSTRAFGAQQLCWLLRQGRLRLNSARREAVAIWRGTLSLFDEQSEVALGLRGAPAWATHAIRLAQQLVHEVGAFEDRADLYEAQIVASQQAGCCVNRIALLRILSWADDLQERLERHLPEMHSAREALDRLPPQDGFLGRPQRESASISVRAVPLWRDIVNGSYVGAGTAWREQVGLQLAPISDSIPTDIIEPKRGFLHPLWSGIAAVRRASEAYCGPVVETGLDLAMAFGRALGVVPFVVLGREKRQADRQPGEISAWQAPAEIARHTLMRSWQLLGQCLHQAPTVHGHQLLPPCLLPPQLTIGYWNIRGLGAPLRMMCAYSGVEFFDQRYEAHQKNNGRWSAKEWELGDKLDLQERNEFSVLPYVVNETSGDVIAQSNAVSLYLGRLLGLNGMTAKAQAANEQVLFQMHTMWMEVYELVYPFKHNKDMEDFEESLEVHLRMALPEFYSQLEAWLYQVGTEFVAGWRPCVADFHVWEVLDQHERMSRAHGYLSPLDDFDLLKEYYLNFRNLQQLQNYFASPAAILPVNNKMAFFK